MKLEHYAFKVKSWLLINSAYIHFESLVISTSQLMFFLLFRSGYRIKIRYDPRLSTSKAELIDDFEKIYCKMNEMSLQLDKKSQVKQFIKRAFLFVAFLCLLLSCSFLPCNDLSVFLIQMETFLHEYFNWYFHTIKVSSIFMC